jgi:CRP/FNR family transcriptional regulator, cyclic AMP receptor protein
MSKHRLFPFFERAPAPPEAPLSAGEHSRSQMKRDYLSKQMLFCDLPAAEIGALERQIRMVTCPKGRILYSQEDRAEALFLLKHGRVRLYRLTPSGKRLELATLGPGMFFGEMPLLGESLRHAFAEAVEDSLICVMSRVDVERLIRDKPAVALRMIEAMSQRLAEAQARLEEVAYSSVAARIAAVLLRLSEGRTSEMVLMTHQELGDMVGAVRATVTEVLNELQAAGLVELQRGHIRLRDSAGLRSLLED